MKRLTLLLALALATLAWPASGEIVFLGSIVWTNASNCPARQFPGRSMISVYHPRGAGNANFSGLTYFDKYFGAGFHLQNGDFTASFKDVEAHGLGWSGFGYSGAKVRILQRILVPAGNLSTNTRFATLRGQLIRPDNDEGISNRPCVVTFEAAYRRE